VLEVCRRREELKGFNGVESCTQRTRGAFTLVASRRVHDTREGGEWETGNTEREEADGVRRDTCIPVIGQRDFYLILSLNSIISLQTIIIFFYIKIHDFFFVYKY
jgi:hypothetical protein